MKWNLCILCLCMPLLSSFALVKCSRRQLNIVLRSKRSNECVDVDILAAAKTSPSSSSPPPPSSPSSPWWVTRLNHALNLAPLGYVCSFVLIDISSCLCILATLQWRQVNVSPEFTLAYAISKALRFQRLALDAAGAKFVTVITPAVNEVKVDLIIDAIKACRETAFGGILKGGGNDNMLKKTATEATKLSSKYGLALMASKNLIGPINHILLYYLLKNGIDLSQFKWLSWVTVSDTSAAVGRMAYA